MNTLCCKGIVPGTRWTADDLAAHDVEKAIDEANWLAQSDAEIAAGIVPVDDGNELTFAIPSTDAPTYCNGCSKANGTGHDANCFYYKPRNMPRSSV